MRKKDWRNPRAPLFEDDSLITVEFKDATKHEVKYKYIRGCTLLNNILREAESYDDREIPIHEIANKTEWELVERWMIPFIDSEEYFPKKLWELATSSADCNGFEHCFDGVTTIEDLSTSMWVRKYMHSISDDENCLVLLSKSLRVAGYLEISQMQTALYSLVVLKVLGRPDAEVATFFKRGLLTRAEKEDIRKRNEWIFTFMKDVIPNPFQGEKNEGHRPVWQQDDSDNEMEEEE